MKKTEDDPSVSQLITFLREVHTLLASGIQRKQAYPLLHEHPEWGPVEEALIKRQPVSDALIESIREVTGQTSTEAARTYVVLSQAFTGGLIDTVEDSINHDGETAEKGKGRKTSRVAKASVRRKRTKKKARKGKRANPATKGPRKKRAFNGSIVNEKVTNIFKAFRKRGEDESETLRRLVRDHSAPRFLMMAVNKRLKSYRKTGLSIAEAGHVYRTYQ